MQLTESTFYSRKCPLNFYVVKPVDCEALLGSCTHRTYTEGLMDSKVNMPDADEPRDLAEMDEQDVLDPLEDYEDDLMDDYPDEDDDDLFDDETDEDDEDY